MMRKWDIAIPAIVCALVAILVAFIYYRTLHYLYFVGGPYLYDMEMFNYIVGPDSKGLSMPSVIGLPSFFYIHMSPILLLFNFVSSLIGLKDNQPLELMLCVGFAGAAAAAFAVIAHYLKPLGQVAAIPLAAVFAVAFALSGIMRATADYPHFEVLYTPLAVIALLLIFQRHKGWGWVAFSLCLLVREDAGLHLACILGAYLVLAAIKERGIPERTRDLAPFLAAALVYPAFALLAQSMLFPTESTFSRIYSGAPAYAHLTHALLAQHWNILLHERRYVLLTLAAALAAFVFRPGWIALTGIVAAIPWLVLNVTAVSDAAGTLQLYYPFPFVALVLVPFVVTAGLPTPKDVYVDHL